VFLNLLFWIAHFFLFSFLAYISLGYFRSGRRSLDLAILVFLWIFYTTCSLMLFGLLGWLTGGALGISSLLVLLILLSFKPCRTRLGQFLSSWTIFARELRRWWRDHPRWLKLLVGVATVFGLVRFAFLIWALPPFIWDSLVYHLTNVGQWIHQGRIELFLTSSERVYSPANYEVFATWFGVFIHHDLVIEASGLPAYLLGGLSVFAITRGLGGRQQAATVATIAYLSAPAFLFAVTNTKNDPYVAGVYLLCVAILLNIFPITNDTTTKKPVGMFMIFIASVLFALGTKTYMAHIFTGLVFLGVVEFIRNRASDRMASLRQKITAEMADSGTYAKWIFLGLLVSAMFLGSYWYLRNLSLKGTPFYPYSVRVEGTTMLEGEGNTFDLSPENFYYNLQAFASKFGDKQYRIVPDLSNTTGWGWVIYGMGLVACIWAMAVLPRFRLVFVAFLMSFLFIAISLPRSPWNLRYVIWIPAVFAVALGLFFENTGPWSTRTHTFLIGLFWFCLGMNGMMSLTYNLIPLDQIQAMLALPAWERDAGKFHLQVPIEYDSVYEYVPNDAVLGYNLHENGFVYPLLRADFSQDLAYIPIARNATCQEIAGEMRSNNTRYLFVAPVHTEDYAIGILEDCARAGDFLRERAPGLFVIKADD
jgi:hypothetical protein